MAPRSTEYQQVMSLLKTMPPADIAQLREFLKSIPAGGSVPVVAPRSGVKASGTETLVTLLMHFLAGAGAKGASSVSSAAVQRALGSRHVQAASDKIAVAWEYICQHATSRIEREALLRIAFRCQYDALQKWMTDGVGLVEMLNNLDKLPTYMDASFPGYARSNLLKFIIRSSAA